MFQFIKSCDNEICKPEPMPESTRKILEELLAQNRMILEANCEAIKLINRPIIMVSGDPSNITENA